ncbi:MAG: DNA polymerase III subunit alpha [bacterium]|nr:DNA polymerase III subunit alpha [bacterium]
MSNFVHLHSHSHYSLLDGMSRIDEWIKVAKETGMPAIAMTDHGNMYGAIKFYKACKAADIKPIIGIEGYVANRTRFDKQPGVDNKRYHITLLAENNTGYKNLIKLITKAYLEGYYYKPRFDRELLKEHSEGIICLSGCLGGEFCQALWNNDEDQAERVALEYRDIFGKDNYFIELMHHPGLERFMEIKEKIIKVARKLDIPMVGTQDSHYTYPSQSKAHDVMLAIQTQSDITDTNRLTLTNDDFSFIPPEKAWEHFGDTPDAIENTIKIADRCNVEIELGSWVFPDYRIPEGTTFDEEFRRISYAGFPFRKLEQTKEYIDRLEYELKIIADKGFSVYMLIVADILHYARQHNILTTIRGSVAGSLATYLSGITTLDPIEYELPFERFLNPERPSAPDIDMDFADNRRDEVINYVREKYGNEKVAQIGTLGTMMARGAVRDVARAMGHPYATGDKISKLIPLGAQGFPMTIDRAMEMTPELKELYESDPNTKEIVDIAKEIEGCSRHVSVHAAGVVISPSHASDYVPLQLDPKGGKIITQFDMHDVEGAGLIKFDFLGIRNLAILGRAVELVQEFHDINIDLDHIPLDDKKTFEMLARGETMGLFQLNGAGMTRYLKELKPSTIHDINAMVALYRPGPIEFIPEYIARKHDPSKVDYPHPDLKDILKRSFGLLIYQEDVMLTAIKLANYSWLDADKFRKAMGKKIPALMAEQEEKFKKGCVDNGIEKKTVDDLWVRILPFATYAFNKPHSASYGRLAYQTAYMKANFPAEYMCAILSAEAGDIDKVSEIMTECDHMNIPVLPPYINESEGDFTVIKKEGELDNIRMGLYTIKNFGNEIANAIVSERKAHGRFASYSDFLSRIKHKNLNKKSLEALIMSGSLDNMGERGQLLANMEEALAFVKNQHIDHGGQTSLLGLFEDTRAQKPELKLKEAPLATQIQKLGWEKELLGLYLSGHPLDPYREKIKERGITILDIQKKPDNTQVILAGLIEDVKEIITKNGSRMAFGRISDFEGEIETVIFSTVYAEYKEILEPGTCVAINGRVSHRNGDPSVIVEKIKKLEQTNDG